MLPSDNAPQPLMSEVIAVTSSGREVPSATSVSAMTDSGTPSALARICALSTSSRAPMAMTAAPTMSITTSRAALPSGSSSSCSGAGSGLFFICMTVTTM